MLSASAARDRFRARERVDGARLRRRRDGARGRRCGHPRRAALCRAQTLVPGLDAPDEFRAIVNAHFRIALPPGRAGDPWRHRRHGRMAVRVSRTAFGHDQRGRPADRHAARGTRRRLWREVCGRHRASGGSAALADRARSARDLRRDARSRTPSGPGAQTAWRNLFLAGDWTHTGLPATIEGAIRSGNAAARSVRSGRGQ